MRCIVVGNAKKDLAVQILDSFFESNAFSLCMGNQVSLQHLPTMQEGGPSGDAPRSGQKMLSGLFAKAHTQATGLLAKVCVCFIYVVCGC